MSNPALQSLLVLGSVIAGIVGTVAALIKLAPERASMILDFQLKAIGRLQKEIEDLQAVVQKLQRENGELRERLEECVGK